MSRVHWPIRRKAQCFLGFLTAGLLLSACSGTTETAAPFEELDLGASATAGNVPLPPGSRVTEAKDIPKEDVLDEQPAGTLRPDDLEPKKRVPQIVQRGHLIVGVDQSQNLLSYRNSASGDLAGFEVDLAREIARDIFGNPDAVDFRFVDSETRTQALREGRVDIVIRTMTVTKKRQEQIAFSAPYLTAEAQLLAPKESGIVSTDDLDGRTVCVSQSSTSMATARKYAPDSKVLLVRSWADCLMALQQHQADAVLSDNVILAGIREQDPAMAIVGPVLTNETYAVGIPKPTPDIPTEGLVRQVNSTLERVRHDGTWTRMYHDWLGEYLGPMTLPQPEYQPEEEANG
ncbi:glutamate ABC transporter substrate-binding protein [Corynebacterium ulceribovis]|uniref:glutamate ABC transporter substrate-binding protein n=1 Tax=Corynebacterium ulceribovis TaxID=487732 RepID=UPI0003A148DA|nr:glutamate ABC transporter substrate-binding protein [Corynebacterium ulceribovis]